MQHARPGGVSEQEAEEEQEKEERKKAQGTRRKNKFKMHEDEVKTVLMRVSGSRECTSVQLHHRCPVPIVYFTVFELVFFNFSLQYYQNKQQNRSTVLGLISLGGTGCYFGLLKIAACTELLRSGNTAPLLKISQTGQEIPC